MDWRRKINNVINGTGPDIVFQGIYRLSDLKRIGFESLSRFPEDEPLTDLEMYNLHGPDWKNNNFMGLGPNIWFRQADFLGLGVDLELSAIKKAFSCIPFLPNNHHMAVNVGPETFVTTNLGDLLKEIDISKIVIEITEHLSIPSYHKIKDKLLDIQEQQGLEIYGKIPYMAADDIGSGEASFLHLLELRELLTYAKLDVGMVKGIENDLGRQEIVSAIVNIGNIYGYKVIAEGIEEEEQMKTILDLGVYAGQGWFLHKPQPFLEIK